MLELLALPLDDEWRTRRTEGLQGVRNILWAVGGGGAAAVAGGFTREDFMNQAFLRMTAVEQVTTLLKLPKVFSLYSKIKITLSNFGHKVIRVCNSVGSYPDLILDSTSS